MSSPQAYFFLQQFLHHIFYHGGIGCVDAERILQDRKFVPIVFPSANEFSLNAKRKRLSYLYQTLKRIKSGSVVVFLFPHYARMEKWLLKLLQLKKGVKIICFIADINGLKDGDNELLKQEIVELKGYNYFVVHGQPMQEWLLAHVPGSISSSIEFFDFLTSPIDIQREISKDIVFAGNLSKSPFLEHLHLLPALKFAVYGEGQTDALLQQANVQWLGVEQPYDLPSKLKGSFGLLWDGTTIDKPGGSLGDYMQYITHHKVSLYILAKLPLIVPATAGSAYLVEKYKIGFTVNSLYEIEDKITKLSPAEYQQMQSNMKPLADKISRGGGLREALEELMEKMT